MSEKCTSDIHTHVHLAGTILYLQHVDFQEQADVTTDLFVIDLHFLVALAHLVVTSLGLGLERRHLAAELRILGLQAGVRLLQLLMT